VGPCSGGLACRINTEFIPLFTQTKGVYSMDDIAVQKNLFQWQEMGYKNVYENKEIFAHFG
jgi:hypothetical protein